MLPGVGIFGTCQLARKISVILRNCDFKLEAVWSRTLKDAQAFADDLSIPVSTNKVDGLLLLPEVGFIVIICPPHLLSPIAVKALGIGKHVIAIPPVGPSQLEVLKMVKAATYYPSLLSMSCHGLRYLPAFYKMKILLDRGYIGSVNVFEVKVHSSSPIDTFGWECDVLMGGGALSMHGSYIIDILHYLSGKKATTVHGMLKTFVKNTVKVNGIRQITSDDFCSFQMELEGGASVSCVLNNHCDEENVIEVIAVGSKGRMVVNNMDLYGKLYSNDDQSKKYLHREALRDEDGEYSMIARQRVPFSQGLCRALESVSKAFLADEAVHKWKKELIANRATFDDALYAQTVIDAVRKSNETKNWVKIRILDEEPDPNPHLSSVVRRSALYGFY